MSELGRWLDRKILGWIVCGRCFRQVDPRDMEAGICLDCMHEEAMAETWQWPDEPTRHDYCECCGGLPGQCRCEVSEVSNWDEEGRYYSAVWCYTHRHEV